MTTYNHEPRMLPWPYPTVAPSVPMSQWCTFVHSTEYTRDCADFHIIRQSGDVNAMILFVAHHPYVTTALLQLSLVLYQTNRSHEGMALLHRCLWIYESSAWIGFVQNLRHCDNGPQTYLLDYDQPENKPFMQALFRLVHVSSIAGYVFDAFTLSHFQQFYHSSTFCLLSHKTISNLIFTQLLIF